MLINQSYLHHFEHGLLIVPPREVKPPLEGVDSVQKSSNASHHVPT